MPRPKGARDADYPAKRSALLRKLSARLGRMDDTRPSLRQLAAASDVTVPTLRHYFGTREDLVEAVMAEYRRLGDPYIQLAAEPEGDLDHSLRAYLKNLAALLTGFPYLGDIFAIGFIEGMFHHKLGPACLNHLVDPTLGALQARLEAHQARGEVIEGNMRHGALMLISPLLVACHHQNQMFGRSLRPLDLDALVEDLASNFVRSYGVDKTRMM